MRLSNHLKPESCIQVPNMQQNPLLGGKLPQVVAKFTPKGVGIRDISRGEVALVGIFSPKYFLDYEEAEEEKITLTSTLLEVLNSQFKDLQTVELSTEGGELWIKSIKMIPSEKTYRVYTMGEVDERKTYHEPLQEAYEEEWKLKLKISFKVYRRLAKRTLRTLEFIDERL